MKSKTLSPAEILKRALDSKKRARTRISLRSLAAKLKCSPAFLSKVLSGKAKIPADKFNRYAEAFDLDEYTRRALKAAIARDKLGAFDIEPTEIKVDVQLGAQLTEYHEIRGQQAHEKVLSAWYHLAILDLMTCTPFVSNPGWIAERLGLTIYQVENSLKLLNDAGLAELRHGKWIKTNRRLNFPTSRSMSIVRTYQKQLLQRAIKTLTEATEHSDFEGRLMTSASIAVNSGKIPLAKARLMAAITECIEILTEGPCDEVYSLAIQLFPQQKRR